LFSPQPGAMRKVCGERLLELGKQFGRHLDIAVDGDEALEYLTLPPHVSTSLTDVPFDHLKLLLEELRGLAPRVIQRHWNLRAPIRPPWLSNVGRIVP
jgi:hypothetical protein